MTPLLGAVVGGLVLGAAGSGHCATMCGPLVLLANPRASDRTSSQLAQHTVLYHLGRVAMYSVAGTLIGLTGSALSRAGLGRALAFAAAAAVLLQALNAWHAFRGGSRSGFNAVITRAIGRVGGYMRAHHISGPMAFGALTGLLPCGLVYAALTASSGFGNVAESTLFMFAFGLGTTPLLAAVGLSGSHIERWLPLRVKKLAPLALAAVALLLAVRASGMHTTHASHEAAAPGTHQHAANR